MKVFRDMMNKIFFQKSMQYQLNLIDNGGEYVSVRIFLDNGQLIH